MVSLERALIDQSARTPWLATAGDVLAGVIVALLGQGGGAFTAACAGMWIHSEARRALGLSVARRAITASACRCGSAAVAAGRAGHAGRAEVRDWTIWNSGKTLHVY